MTPALPRGKKSYTVVATTPSSISGNPMGVSVPETFLVNTEPPVVTLNQPKSPSNNTTPTFSGTASEETEATVYVYEGSVLEATASTTASSGNWSTSALSNALSKGKHTFTAYAKEKSALGNEEGNSAPMSFEVNTEAPVVTLAQPASPSKNTSPTFTGTANENTEVVVTVKLGSETVATATTTASGGTWTSGALSKALPKGKHTFTAVAKEKSAFGNPEGESESRSFEVNTEAPVVTLNQPASPSNNTSPKFSGTASENTEVAVTVKLGSETVATATTTASGGTWSTGTLSKALSTGKHSFTAVAKEKSALGNAEGESESRSFEVNTEAPVVTLNQPATPSNNTKPTFSGTASENTEVLVTVKLGSEAVATATATASGGKWTAGALSKALPTGKNSFTAVAKEKSGIGNAEGESTPLVSFEVNTEAPVVTLNQPTTPSNNTKPTFSGTASENTEVIVTVKLGSEAIATASATASGGKWTAATLSKALPTGKNTFTAVAKEKSALGNAEGESATVSFEVNTLSPVVTLESPAPVSNDETPSFSGTASETEPVLVQIYAGTSASGTPVRQLSAEVSGGRWSTAHVSPKLESGQYTVVASEKSAFGDPPGASKPITFEINAKAPTVIVQRPPTPSNNTSPLFEGTVSGDYNAADPVTLYVHEGASAEGPIVRTLTASVGAGGAWKSAAVTPALPHGKQEYTVVATTPSSIEGNPTGESAPATFLVNTEPPVVTLKPLKPSNETSPTFSGTASEETEIQVTVTLGSETLATASTTAHGGSWSTSTLSNALPKGRHTFTALAKEKSALGNGEGESASVSFEVNTESPLVTLTALPTPSPNRSPSLSGTTTEKGVVSVEVYKGGQENCRPVEKEPIETVEAQAESGQWTSGRLKQLPEWGEYTAVASQDSPGQPVRRELRDHLRRSNRLLRPR